MNIDVDRLRKDLMNDAYGAFFGGEFGGALFESFDLKKASDDELIEIAVNKGIDLENYKVY